MDPVDGNMDDVQHGPQQQPPVPPAPQQPLTPEQMMMHNMGMMQQLMTIVQPLLAWSAAQASGRPPAAPAAGAAPYAPTAVPSNFKLPPITTFSGGKTKVVPWLNHTRRLLQAYNIPMDHNAVAIAALSLSGTANSWFEMEANQVPVAERPYGGFHTFDDFATAMTAALGEPFPERKARDQLANLKQKGSVVDYAYRFQEIVSRLPDRHWTDKRHDFLRGLKPEIKAMITGKYGKNDGWETIRQIAMEHDELSADLRTTNRHHHSAGHRHDDPMELGSIQASSSSSSKATSRSPSRGRSPSRASGNRRSGTPGPSSRQPKYAPLTPAEREHLERNNGCVYCRQLGHTVETCQKKAAHLAKTGQPTKN